MYEGGNKMQYNNMDLLVTKSKEKDVDAFSELMKNCTKDSTAGFLHLFWNEIKKGIG